MGEPLNAAENSDGGIANSSTLYGHTSWEMHSSSIGAYSLSEGTAGQ